jgi:GNAT superfamily N-acetyltransferase
VPEVIIRTAGVADHVAVRDVRQRSSLSNAGDREHILANPDTLQYDPAPLRDGRTRVAVADGRIVGFTTTTTTADGRGLELEALFVDPPAMRRGIGRALIDDLVARADRLGLHRIDVTANDHALAFYDAVGFVTDGAVPTRFGSARRMHRDIPSAADGVADVGRER